MNLKYRFKRNGFNFNLFISIIWIISSINSISSGKPAAFIWAIYGLTLIILLYFKISSVFSLFTFFNFIGICSVFHDISYNNKDDVLVLKNFRNNIYRLYGLVCFYFLWG